MHHLQQQLWSLSRFPRARQGIPKACFSQSVSEVPYPLRKGYTKPTPAEALLHVSSEGHAANQAPAAAARGIRATCSHPMSFPGVSQPQAGWSFLAGAARSQPPSFPRCSCSSLYDTASKQEHVAFPQLQRGGGQEQAVATRAVEVAHTLLPRAAGAGTASVACQDTAPHTQHRWTTGSNICLAHATKTLQVQIFWFLSPDEVFINRLSTDSLIKYQY